MFPENRIPDLQDASIRPIIPPMINTSPAYPTPQHASAADAVVEIFSRHAAVEAVLLMGSCARGKASIDSCLDLLILVRPKNLAHHRRELESLWNKRYTSGAVFQELLAVGSFSHVDLEFVDGVFKEPPHDWTSGADSFELEIGNTLAYSLPLWERTNPARGSYYRELQAEWLPYYNETLRRARLAMVLRYCRNNLAHIPLYAPRGLHFQCFKRFYNAFEEFLQALFISRSTYPISYDKWVKEGVADVLAMPELYARLPRLFEISNFESDEIVSKARELEGLIRTYIEEE
jgi:predicted nucleotidyltransferase